MYSKAWTLSNWQQEHHYGCQVNLCDSTSKTSKQSMNYRLPKVQHKLLMAFFHMSTPLHWWPEFRMTMRTQIALPMNTFPVCGIRCHRDETTLIIQTLNSFSVWVLWGVFSQTCHWRKYFGAMQTFQPLGMDTYMLPHACVGSTFVIAKFTWNSHDPVNNRLMIAHFL